MQSLHGSLRKRISSKHKENLQKKFPSSFVLLSQGSLSLVFFEQFYDVIFKDVHSASKNDENGSDFKLVQQNKIFRYFISLVMGKKICLGDKDDFDYAHPASAFEFARMKQF